MRWQHGRRSRNVENRQKIGKKAMACGGRLQRAVPNLGLSQSCDSFAAYLL